jgi:hypothetical protein
MRGEEAAGSVTYHVCWNGGQRVTIENQDAEEFKPVLMQAAKLTFVEGTDCPPSAAKAWRMSIDPHIDSATGSPTSSVKPIENGIGKLVLDYTPLAQKGAMVYLRMHFAPEGLGYGYQINSGKPVIRNDPGIFPSPLVLGLLAAVAGALVGGLAVWKWLSKGPNPPP